MNIVFVWLVLFIVFLVAELVTAGALVSIWFCVGALVAVDCQVKLTHFFV